MATLENTTTKNNKNQLHTERERQSYIFAFDMRTEDAWGVWSRLCCSPGVGWWSSCSPLQEGGWAEDPRFTPTLLLWPAPESWELTKGSSCPLATYLLEIHPGPHEGPAKFPVWWSWAFKAHLWSRPVDFGKGCLGSSQGSGRQTELSFCSPTSLHPMVQTALSSHSALRICHSVLHN